jgi:hypothetical protein
MRGRYYKECKKKTSDHQGLLVSLSKEFIFTLIPYTPNAGNKSWACYRKYGRIYWGHFILQALRLSLTALVILVLSIQLTEHRTV